MVVSLHLVVFGCLFRLLVEGKFSLIANFGGVT